MMDKKKCTKCGEVKLIEQFARKVTWSEDRTSTCNSCRGIKQSHFEIPTKVRDEIGVDEILPLLLGKVRCFRCRGVNDLRLVLDGVEWMPLTYDELASGLERCHVYCRECDYGTPSLRVKLLLKRGVVLESWDEHLREALNDLDLRRAAEISPTIARVVKQSSASKMSDGEVDRRQMLWERYSDRRIVYDLNQRLQITTGNNIQLWKSRESPIEKWIEGSLVHGRKPVLRPTNTE